MTLVNTNTGATGATNVDVVTETIGIQVMDRVKLAHGAPGVDSGDLGTALLAAIGALVQAGGSVTVSASALPTGAATAANQASTNTKLDTLHNDLIAPLPAGTNLLGNVGANVRDGSGTAITSTLIGGKQRLDVTLAAGGTVGSTAPTTADLMGGSDGTNLRAFRTDSDGTAQDNLTKVGGAAITLGQKLMAASVPVVFASDEMQPVQASPNIISGPPSAQSIAATGTIQFAVQGGATVALTLTNAPAATATWVGTVGFQWSPDGSSWNNLSVTPRSSLPGASAVQVTSATAVGLWLATLPANAAFVRYNVTAWTSGTIWCYVESWGQANGIMQLPWTPTVTSGQTLAGWFDASGLAALLIRFSAVTTCVVTVQGTNDPTGTDVNGIAAQDGVTVNATSTATITAAGVWRVNLQGWKWVRVQVTTTGTVLTVQGIVAIMGQVLGLTSIGNSIYATLNNASVSLGQIAGTTAMNPASNGSTNRALVATMGTAVSNVDQSATAFAGAGRVNGTIVASATAGGGACLSAEINVSALTLGTATSVVAILQESRGGTNFTDIWTSDPITTAGIVSMPAIPIGGRRRWCFHSVGGTSTTVTVTITALELPAGYVRQAQFRDAYAATNPLATVINSVTQTASTFGAATALTATTQATSWFPIEGCKTITGCFTLGGGPTVTTQPVIALELSNDLTNAVVPSGATVTAAGNGTYACTITGQCFRYARLRVTTAAAYSVGAYTVSAVQIQGVN